MSPMVADLHWMLVLKMSIVFFGLLVQNHFCEASSLEERIKPLLFVSDNISVNARFPSKPISPDENGTELCFNIPANKNNGGCCNNFNCDTTVKQTTSTTYNLILNGASLTHDIVVLMNSSFNFSCMPSTLYNSTENWLYYPLGFIHNLDKCLRPGGKNVRLSQEDLNNCAKDVACDEKSGNFCVFECI
ncbi:uncharacterized protein V3H82_022335 [Fundulus diaphanus]